MKKRVLAGVLWFFAVAYAWNVVALVLGLPDVPGYGLGIIAAFLFELGIITYRIVFFYGATAVDKAGFIDHAFGQRCFSAAGMAEQRNIFYVSSIKGWHSKSFKFPKLA